MANMDLLDRKDFVSQVRLALLDWRPRPNTGQILKDVLFVLWIAFIQTTIFPSLFGVNGYVDLMTPWLVVTCIRQKPLQAMLLASCGALVLETRLAVPAGIYICTYWILCSFLIQIRPALSWRYRLPWLVCYLGATLWVLLFESFVINFLQADLLLKPHYYLQALLRLGVATGFGMYLSREWMNIDAEEPVPQ